MYTFDYASSDILNFLHFLVPFFCSWDKFRENFVDNFEVNFVDNFVDNFMDNLVKNTVNNFVNNFRQFRGDFTHLLTLIVSKTCTVFS